MHCQGATGRKRARKRGARADWKVERREGKWKKKRHNVEKRSVCVQINVDVFERVKGRVGNFGLFSLAHLPGEAAMNRKV